MAQKNFWGEHEPEYTPSVADLMRRLDDDVPSGDRQRIVIAVHPVTDAFLEDAVRINGRDVMWRRFLKWLQALGPLETICRNSRPSKTQEPGKASDQGKRPSLRTTPEWYDRYRTTDHWEDIRRRAMTHYGGCVLCGSIERPHLHHRDYNSLGNEQIRDVAILCHAHHGPMHQLLGLKVPRIMPDAVERLLRIEQKL
ncbi:MAG: hypothetical protein ACYTEX_27565 [Planctomycetota bacterium]|jgi:hypothetical protein